MANDELEELLDERAIRRVLYSYCRAIDRLDIELLRDCYWPEATDRHGPFTGTRDEYVAWVTALLRRHTMTMHQLGNILIDLDGDTAHAETYAVAYHSGEPPGDIRWNYVAGFRYVDTFGRRDGQWRIMNRLTAIEWTQAWDADRERLALFGEHLPRRDGTDPVYRRPA
ncbi:hypothetical protein N602_26640 [Mycobacterium avium subsp. hominissuis 10-5606]|nr:hypothetical protein N602_26640 [Mycobacterium avium subsp. hominissuis 10-5606]